MLPHVTYLSTPVAVRYAYITQYYFTGQKTLSLVTFTANRTCPTCPANSYCVNNQVIPCQTNYISPPGAADVSLCQPLQVLVNFTINGASTGINQSVFENALPSSIAMGQYEDVLVVYENNCPVGYFCPGDTTTATPCPAGSYNNYTNAVSLSDCLVCPVAEYCPIASSVPTPCAAGSFRTLPGATAQGDCGVCPTGNFCPIQSVSPTNCSAGTYNPSIQGMAPSACLPCPAGEFCGLATTTPVACAAGSYTGTTGGTEDSEADCSTLYDVPQRKLVPQGRSQPDQLHCLLL